MVNEFGILITKFSSIVDRSGEMIHDDFSYKYTPYPDRRFRLQPSPLQNKSYMAQFTSP